MTFSDSLSLRQSLFSRSSYPPFCMLTRAIGLTLLVGVLLTSTTESASSTIKVEALLAPSKNKLELICRVSQLSSPSQSSASVSFLNMFVHCPDKEYCFENCKPRSPDLSSVKCTSDRSHRDTLIYVYTFRMMSRIVWAGFLGKRFACDYKSKKQTVEFRNSHYTIMQYGGGGGKADKHEKHGNGKNKDNDNENTNNNNNNNNIEVSSPHSRISTSNSAGRTSKRPSSTTKPNHAQMFEFKPIVETELRVNKTRDILLVSAAILLLVSITVNIIFCINFILTKRKVRKLKNRVEFGGAEEGGLDLDDDDVDVEDDNYEDSAAIADGTALIGGASSLPGLTAAQLQPDGSIQLVQLKPQQLIAAAAAGIPAAPLHPLPNSHSNTSLAALGRCPTPSSLIGGPHLAGPISPLNSNLLHHHQQQQPIYRISSMPGIAAAAAATTTPNGGKATRTQQPTNQNAATSANDRNAELVGGSVEPATSRVRPGGTLIQSSNDSGVLSGRGGEGGGGSGGSEGGGVAGSAVKRARSLSSNQIVAAANAAAKHNTILQLQHRGSTGHNHLHSQHSHNHHALHHQPSRQQRGALSTAVLQRHQREQQQQQQQQQQQAMVAAMAAAQLQQQQQLNSSKLFLLTGQHIAAVQNGGNAGMKRNGSVESSLPDTSQIFVNTGGNHGAPIQMLHPVPVSSDQDNNSSLAVPLLQNDTLQQHQLHHPDELQDSSTVNSVAPRHHAHMLHHQVLPASSSSCYSHCSHSSSHSSSNTQHQPHQQQQLAPSNAHLEFLETPNNNNPQVNHNQQQMFSSDAAQSDYTAATNTLIVNYNQQQHREDLQSPSSFQLPNQSYRCAISSTAKSLLPNDEQNLTPNDNHLELSSDIID